MVSLVQPFLEAHGWDADIDPVLSFHQPLTDGASQLSYLFMPTHTAHPPFDVNEDDDLCRRVCGAAASRTLAYVTNHSVYAWLELVGLTVAFAAIVTHIFSSVLLFPRPWHEVLIALAGFFDLIAVLRLSPQVLWLLASTSFFWHLNLYHS